MGAGLLFSYWERGCRQNPFWGGWGGYRTHREAAPLSLPALVASNSEVVGSQSLQGPQWLVRAGGGLAAREAGGVVASPHPGPAASFLFSGSVFSTAGQREAERTPEKDEKEQKGARWRARLSPQTHSILSVT